MGLNELSVARQTALLEAGEIAPADLVSDALTRIDEVQPHLNCFVEVWADQALDRARELGRVPIGRRGPLHGIPVAIKDTTPWSGHRLTLGSLTQSENVATSTAWVVDRLLESGAVIVGSTNSPEFAHSSFTDNRLWGPTRNPHDPRLSPGGSSGGSAVAVATGCVALAEGTDMGGSVRIPAAWCGVVGLKPSLGRIPMDALPGLWDSLSHHGPLARSADDAWRFLLATQGPSLRDPYAVLAPLDGDLDVDPAGLRVALSVDLGCWAVDPEIERAVRSTADRLGDLGADVVEVDPGFTADDERLWVRMWGVFMAGYYGHLADSSPESLDPDVLELIRLGRSMSAVDVRDLELRRTSFWRRVAKVLDHHEVILCPTMSTPPFSAAKADYHEPARVPGRLTNHDMTSVWNLASPCPAVSFPIGHHHNRVPIGGQLIGRPGAERTILSIVSALTVDR